MMMDSKRLESERLHTRAKRWVSAFERGTSNDDNFDAFGIAIARHQASHIPGYARLCAHQRIDWQNVSTLAELPAVPTDAFKLAHVFAFAKEDAAFVFRTSGTTIGERGNHFFRDVSTYDRAAVAFGERAVLGTVSRPVRVIVVGPSPNEVPDSSLTHMFAAFAQSFGEVGAEREIYFIRNGDIDMASLRAAVCEENNGFTLVLGTSFAFVHLLDALARGPSPHERWPLAKGGLVLHTGGYKGRSREVPADELRQSIAALFALPESQVAGEYGMTELSSQFYEAKLTLEAAADRVYVEPPWARVIPVDPISLKPVANGDVGIARIEDLMNIDSAVAILVPDRVRRVKEGFELLGRLPGVVPRGCSIAIDEMLG